MQERKDCLKIIISKNRNWTTQSTKGDPRPGTAKHALQARKEALKKEQADPPEGVVWESLGDLRRVMQAVPSFREHQCKDYPVLCAQGCRF